MKTQFVCNAVKWQPEQDAPTRIKSILWGAIAAIGIFLISLTILIGIGG